MHVKAIPQPLLRLATDFTIASLAPARGHEVRCEVVAKVLADGCALGQHNGLGEGRGGDGDQRRFSKRVDGFELRRRELVGHALVDFYGVGGVFGTFFEQPYDALGAGLLEPASLLGFIFIIAIEWQRVVCEYRIKSRRLCVHSRAGKSTRLV